MGASAAAVVGGTMLVGAGLDYVGNQSAARKEENAANAAGEQRIAGQNKALAEFEPWRGMEDKARTSMGDILGYNGTDAATSAYDALMKSPAFQMRLKTGQEGIDRSAAAGGGLFSGNTGKALVQYGQDLGSEEFGNEYARRAGMMDWAYGNTGNRAKIYTGLGDIGAETALRVGAAGARGSMGLSNAFQTGLGDAGAMSSIYKNVEGYRKPVQKTYGVYGNA